MGNIYYTMTLPTSKQIIEKLSEFDGIILGGLNKDNWNGLSNDFYVDKVLSIVNEQVDKLTFASIPITHDRTLWIISTKLSKSKSLRLLNHLK